MKTRTVIPIPDLEHQRSNDILEFVVRNHFATNQTLHRRVLHTPEISPATVQKLVRRLIDRNLLKRWRLHGSRSYVRLGEAAIVRWQYDEKYYRPLRAEKLRYGWGSLSLMAYHQPLLTRLLPHEVELFLPGFEQAKDLNQWAYYCDRSEEVPRLATVRVEFRIGGDAVIRKLQQQLHDYRRHWAFNDLLDESRLIMHIVTATQEQEHAILDAADRLGFPAELRVSRDPSLTLFL